MTTPDDLVQIHFPDIWEATITLSPTHPRTAELLREAGVTEARLNTPLIKFWRHHHLATTDEMSRAFAFAEKRFKFNVDYPAGVDWYDAMIAQTAVMGDFMSSDSRAVEEPTMIVVNVGAHLRAFELGDKLWSSDYIEGLKNVVGLQIPASFALSVC